MKNKLFIGIHIVILVFLGLAAYFSFHYSGQLNFNLSKIDRVPMTMIWNVFLALLAFDFACVACYLKNIFLKLISAVLWLAFYPNTFYMITDNKHFADWLSTNGHLPLSGTKLLIYFNLLSFGILLGVLLGIFSIKLMMDHYIKNTSLRFVIIVVLSVLSSIGIYAGRSEDLRLNSWDFATQPVKTLEALISTINGENLIFMLTFTLIQIALIMLVIFMADLKISETMKTKKKKR